MTISYSLDVANTRFCGFMKLLTRWKGSIYKILWKEFLVFVLGYAALSVTYRLFLNDKQRHHFENWVLYFENFIDLIPLSFVLGFYVSLVIGRWWDLFDTIPWPDRMCYVIGAYVHGADERSTLIRRTLGRYLILMQAITFQSVSTAVKRRFPTSQHLVSAGLMTKEERTILETLETPYGKWWHPAQWFFTLAMRAKKEGRIKDSILLDGLLREFMMYRNACGRMNAYDWISVPLVYTQVVTLATYTYSVALMVGRQYLDPKQHYNKHEVDLYVPICAFLQFFFYVGWLKVAEQIVNPCGEDDDDFELNWCLDRSCQVVYLLVDHFRNKHPKLRKDAFWDEIMPQLPQTKISAKNIDNPQLGSAFYLEVNPADSEFLPMDTLLEEDSEANMYLSDTVKKKAGIRYRHSFLAHIFNSQFGQSIRRRYSRSKSVSLSQGHINPAFTSNMDKLAQAKGTAMGSRKSSLARKSSLSHSRSSSISFHRNSISRHRLKLYNVQQAERNSLSNGSIPECEGNGVASAMATAIAPVVEKQDQSNEADSAMLNMPPIPEELSRVVSAISLELVDDSDSPSDKLDDVQNLVSEASKVLGELNRVVNSQGHRKECELKGYKSCCSFDNDDSDIAYDVDLRQDTLDENSVAIDMNKSLLDHHDDSRL